MNINEKLQKTGISFLPGPGHTKYLCPGLY
jgi:hypothetical protein